jgi:hypothetical protein
MCYALRPAVPGTITDSPGVDWSRRPVQIEKLVYTFEGWLDDPLLTSTPVFIVTADLAAAIRLGGFTGVTFDEVEIAVTEEFVERYPEIELPEYRWLKVHGLPCRDDVGLLNHVIVVSQRMLDLLRSRGLSHATVSKLDKAFWAL